MFKYKTEAELSAMTAEQRDIYAEQKREFEAKQAEKMVQDAIDKALPKPTPEEIKTAAEAEAAKAKEIEEIKETVNQIKERTTTGPVSTVKMIDEVTGNKDKLKAMLKGGPEVVLKANTVRASITTNPNQMVLPGVGQLLRLARSLYEIFRKVTLPVGSHNGDIKYIDWDEDTTVKAAAVVAEGAAFPASTAKFKGYTISLKKIGDTLPVSEEFFEDEVNAAAELDMFLENNVDAEVDDQIVNGDNTGENLKGLLESVPAYAAAASAIQDANIYDLITKVKGVITSAGGKKYRPDFAAMNNTTINRLLLKKDQNDNYQFPPNHPIFSMVVEDNNIADNVLVVGDKRYATIYEMGGVTLSKGLVSAQFVEDMVTLKARKRLLFLIKNSDRSGFRKVTDITAALATLSS